MELPTVRPAAVASGRVTVAPDLDLAWESRGTGPDLVMVNNFFMEAAHWRSVTSELMSSCRIVTYDLRNQGASGWSGPSCTWEDHVSDLRCLLDHLGMERTYLLGTSDSALLCRDFTLRHPKRVRGLILVGPSLSPWGEDRHRRITKSWIDTLDHQGMAGLFAQSYPLVFSDHLIESLGASGYAGLKLSFLARHTHDELRAALEVSLTAIGDPRLLTEIDCPTLLLIGDDDFILGPTGAAEIARMMPDARLVTLPRSGHLPYIDATADFEAEVATFVAEVERAGGLSHPDRAGQR
jgi:3-oxoadipate enol-lactonase